MNAAHKHWKLFQVHPEHLGELSTYAVIKHDAFQKNHTVWKISNKNSGKKASRNEKKKDLKIAYDSGSKHGAKYQTQNLENKKNPK